MMNNSCACISKSDVINSNVTFRQLRIDDNTLLKMFRRICVDIQEKKSRLDKIRKKKDDDYLDLLLARLSYEFSKEEFSALSTEIERRGLTVQQV